MSPVQAMIHLSVGMESLCPGLENAARSASRNGQIMHATVRGSKLECTMMLGQGARGAYVGLALKPVGSLFGVDSILQTIIMRRIDGPALGEYSANGANAAVFTGSGQKELLAILDKVPQAARPVAYISRSVYRNGWGGMPYKIQQPWVAFGNGLALNGACKGWSPLNGPPTVQNRADDCDVINWRKSGRNYVFTDEDGDVSGAEDVVVGTGFARGEQSAIAVESTSTGGSGISSEYTMGSASRWDGRLILTADGQFRGSADSSFLATGSGAVAYSGGSKGGIEGTYAADGFLIAIRDDQGGVIIKPIAKSPENGEIYMYYEGTFYWPMD